MSFPTDPELTDAADRLELLYQTEAVPPREPQPTHIDPLGWFRWAGDYRQLRVVEGKDHETAYRQIEAAIRAIWHPEQPPVPQPPGPDAGLKGKLRIQGGVFVDDTGPVLPTFCHFGEAFSAYIRRPDDVKRQLQEIASAGYHGIRFWDVLGYYDGAWRNKEVTPVGFTNKSGQSVPATQNYYGQLDRFLRDVAGYGLKVHHSRGDLNSLPFSAVLDHCRAVGEIQRNFDPAVVALNESCNESWQNGIPEPSRLAQMGERLGNHALRALSCPDGATELPDDLNAFGIPPADVFYVHGFRQNRSLDRIRHIFTINYEGQTLKHRLGWQGEPAGPGDGVTVGQENHPEALALMCAMSLMCRQAWVYMSGNGVFWNGPLVVAAGMRAQMNATTLAAIREADGARKAIVNASQDWDFTKHQPGFLEVARVSSWMPKTTMGPGQLCHGGTSWTGTRVLVANADGTLRCDHAIHTDDTVEIIVYGEPGTWTVPVARGFTGHVVHPVTGAKDPIRLTAGQNWPVTFERGRVLIGALS